MRIGEPALDHLRNAEMHRGDVVAGEAVLLPQRQHGVDAGGDARGCRMRLHQHVHEQELCAEPVLDDRRLEAVGIGARETAAALDHVDRAGKAVLGQQRRGDAALRGMRGLDALAGGARVVELRDAAGIAAGEPDRREDSFVGAAEQQPARGRGGAEHVAGAGALEAALEMAGLHRKPDPDRHLVAGNDRRQHLAVRMRRHARRSPAPPTRRRCRDAASRRHGCRRHRSSSRT